MPAFALIGLMLAGVWVYKRLANNVSGLDLSTQSGAAFNESSVGSDGSVMGGGGVGSFQQSLATNDGWAQVAINGLIQQGYDPSSVEQAIADFINGGQLTAAEQAIVNKALLEYGAPPSVVRSSGSGSGNPAPAPVSGTPAVPTYHSGSTSTVTATPITYDPTYYNPTVETTLPPSTTNGDGTTTYQTPTGPVTAPTAPPERAPVLSMG